MESGQVVAKKYRLNRVLGQGGMATVWSATNIFTERDFAIKMLLPQIATSQEAVDRFLQEAKVSARVDHPNIIDILDVERSEDGALFLVMELLSGMSLETALRRQSPPMTVPELVFVMVEVARALAAAHRAGVVHRDLKPTNIFLHRERNGQPSPKVLDFGVSKFYEEERSRVHALTVAGTVLGSPMYMSPEQARGETKVDGRSDIFSFGAIIFEALCGFRAYDAPNFNALIVKIATKEPRDIDVEAPHVPASLRDIVKKCLEPVTTSRPNTFDEVAEALMQSLPDLEAKPLTLPPPASGYLHADPDATNALPVIRPSDRPPPSMSYPPLGRSPSNPALSGPISIPPPPGTPTASTVPSGAHAIRPAWSNPQVWLIAMGAAAFVVVLSLVVMFAMHGMNGPSEAVAEHHEPSTPLAVPAGHPAEPPKAPPAVESHDWTVIPAATPSAAAQAPVNAPAPPAASARATSASGSSDKPRPGRIAIGSSPVPCTLVVDGVKRGQTPVAALDLAPGAHKLTCTAKGKTQEHSFNVAAGTSGRHVFKF